MPSRVHLTNVCTVDFDLDDTIPPLAKSLYRILKAHVRKNSDFTTSQFVKPSLDRLRKIMHIGSDKLQNNLKVLQIVGLVIVHHGKKRGKRNEVNEYEIIDDLFVYKPNENMKLGEGKDLFDDEIVLSLFDAQEFPEKPLMPPPVEIPEAVMTAAKTFSERLQKAKMPGVVTDAKRWAEIFVKLIEKHKELDIQKVIATAEYGVNSSFWSAHITSPAKFQKKFTTLYIQKFKGKADYGVPINQTRSSID